jgi:hypothetical protein
LLKWSNSPQAAERGTRKMKNEDERRKCPNCRAPFVSEKTLRFSNRSKIKETDYLCGAKVKWDVNCVMTYFDYLRPCTSKKKDEL